MSLENGILGYLAIKPLTGYDIKKLFNMSAAFFWPADQAQIYRSLKKLVDEGQVELIDYEQGETVNRKVYSITEKGRESVHNWVLSTEISDYTTRAPYTMKLFFSGMLTREEQLTFLNTQIEDNRRLLQQLNANYKKNSGHFIETSGLSGDDPRFKSAAYASRWGALRCEAYIKFLEEMKAEIEEDVK